MGFTTGKASPCCFYHKSRQISIVVHGDDFTALGVDSDLDWYESELAKHFELKIRGRIGEGCPGPNKIKILNRCVELTENGLIYEADPRHAELLARSTGLDQGRRHGVTTDVKATHAQAPVPDSLRSNAASTREVKLRTWSVTS